MDPSFSDQIRKLVDEMFQKDVAAHQQFLERTLRHAAWVIGTVAVACTGVFFFVFGDSMQAMRSDAQARIDATTETVAITITALELKAESAILKTELEAARSIEQKISEEILTDALRSTLTSEAEAIVSNALDEIRTSFEHEKEAVAESFNSDFIEQLVSRKLTEVKDVEAKALILDALLPVGSIVAWDPVIRDTDGKPTGIDRELPRGWELCDGLDGTPNLKEMFLTGVTEIGGAGETGGALAIESSGSHSHNGATKDAENGRTTWLAFVDKGGGTGSRETVWGQHNHGITKTLHSHGENRPPFYTVVFIMKLRE
jgi:hypothetical protein